MWIIKKEEPWYLKQHVSFQTIKTSFRSSEQWRPKNNALCREWKDFKERKRIERLGETRLQKFVRTFTGYSPLRRKTVEFSNTQEKY
jgi:hypothetical protein